MLSWSRPDPLTRDLVHMINARRHDHGDTEAAIDTLQAFLEQGREYDLLTVLAALDRNGMRAALLVAGATDGDVFRVFVEHVLAPKLHRGDIVVLDNLGAHKAAGVAEAIAAAGAQLRYLPPYSPDYNPIELAWSKIKGQLRTAGARTRQKLNRCLRVALQQITRQEAQAWFRHDGYSLH